MAYGPKHGVNQRVKSIVRIEDGIPWVVWNIKKLPQGSAEESEYQVYEENDLHYLGFIK